VAAALLASGSLCKDVAAQAGIGERTLRRWRSEPAFKALVADLRSGMVSAAAGRLADGMSAAADVLKALLKDEDANVRLKAASKVVELGLRVRSEAEMEERLSRVEALLSGGGDCGDLECATETAGDDGAEPSDPPGGGP
jgi:HEAT repeat protein